MIFLGPASRGRRKPWDLEGVEFLSAIEPEGPCDGSHGRFCVECAGIVRTSTSGPTSTKGA